MHVSTSGEWHAEHSGHFQPILGSEVVIRMVLLEVIYISSPTYGPTGNHTSSFIALPEVGSIVSK